MQDNGNSTTLISVKDVIENCDTQYLIDGVASCLGYRSTYQRSKLDNKVKMLISEVRALDISCNPNVVLLEYTGMSDGFLTSNVDIYSLSDIRDKLICIPEWNQVVPCIFPDDEPDDDKINLLSLDYSAIVALTVHAVKLLPPLRWTQNDLELILSSRVYYTSEVTQRILACDILAHYLMKSGVQRIGKGGTRWINLEPFSIPIFGVPQKGDDVEEFEEFKDDLYTMISLYHELYQAYYNLINI